MRTAETARRAKITGRTLHLYGPFDAELAQMVVQIPCDERLAIRTLDLSDVDYVFADGALPVVAEFLRRGKSLRIRCEGRPHVERTLELHGWLNLLRDGRASTNTAVPQRVRQFTSANVIDTFVTQTVNDAMQRKRYAKDVLKSFEWSLSEIIGNVFTHSRSEIGALAQALVLPSAHMIRFSVVDTGVGLRGSLLQRYPDLKDDASAIRLAIQRGITRDTDVGQGWGLFGTSKIAASSGGFLSIWTGTARMVIDSSGHTEFMPAPLFQGTALDFSLRTDRALSLQKAIDAVYDPTSIVFNAYEGQVGQASIRLLDHAKAFSDRVIGKKLRNIVLNVLIQPGNEVCVIDFSNVRIVASSFADEFLGKMAVDLGPAFEIRIRLRNVSEDNGRIIATAIAARRTAGLKKPLERKIPV